MFLIVCFGGLQFFPLCFFPRVCFSRVFPRIFLAWGFCLEDVEPLALQDVSSLRGLWSICMYQSIGSLESLEANPR